MKNGILVGYYDMGNGAAPVACLIDTGDLVVLDDLCGPTYISEITVEDPMEYTGSEDICEQMGVTGVVICSRGMYLFKENGYYFAPMEDLGNPKFVSTYDTELAYDGDDINLDDPDED